MSLITRALRRDAAPGAPIAATPEVEHADAVLATLGYSSTAPHRSVPGPVTRGVVILLCIVAVVAGFWLGKPTPPPADGIALADRELETSAPAGVQTGNDIGKVLNLDALVPPAPSVGTMVGERPGDVAAGESMSVADSIALGDEPDRPTETASGAGLREVGVSPSAARSVEPVEPLGFGDGAVGVSGPVGLPGDLYLRPEAPRAALGLTNDPLLRLEGVPPAPMNERDRAQSASLVERFARTERLEQLRRVPGRRLDPEVRPRVASTLQPPTVADSDLAEEHPPYGDQFSDEELQALLDLDVAAIRRRAAASMDGEPFGVGVDGPTAAPRGSSAPAVTRSERRPPVGVTPPKPPPPAAIGGRTTRSVPSNDFRVALRYHEAGDFERAETRYREMIARNDTDPEPHNNLGVLYQEHGYADQAIREFERALAIDPAYVKAHNNLGVTLLGVARWDEAVREFELALSSDPENLESLVNRGLAQNATGRSDDAVDTLLLALDLDPRSAEAHYNLGLVYDGRGTPERALEHYRLFLALGTDRHPTLAESVRHRVEVLAANQLVP